MKKSHQSGSEAWTLPEIEWFSKNSYNLAIKHLSIWLPRYSLRMIISCIAFIDQYPTNVAESVSDDLSLRKIFCSFSAATALIVMARREDVIEAQLQHYLNVRKYVDVFNQQLHQRIENLELEPAQDLRKKSSILLAFDFEAACKLKSWDHLENLVSKASICKSMHVYDLMADCILAAQSPGQGQPPSLFSSTP